MIEGADKEIARIERTQQELRDSIARVKELAEDADKLINDHKKMLQDGPPAAS